MLLMMIPNGTFVSSFAVLLIFVTFVKLASKKLAMLIFSFFFPDLDLPLGSSTNVSTSRFLMNYTCGGKGRGNSKAELGRGSSVSRI